MPSIQDEQIYEIFDKLNKQYFEAKLPYIRILWCDSFGNGKYFKQYGDFTAMPGKRPHIRLSRTLCDHPKQVAITLYHEMVHFWLYVNKRPWGHTKEFHQKLKEFQITL